jgi:hypothetical protein
MDEIEARVFANIIDRQPDSIIFGKNGMPTINVNLKELTPEERKIISRFLKCGIERER